MEREKIALISALRTHKSLYEGLMKACVAQDKKSNFLSEKYKNKGNSLFVKIKYHSTQQHEAIFEYYCKSIAFAGPGSQELALGFGNRSAFLFHIEKYQDCIEDLNRALALIDLNVSKMKFLVRKIKCLKALNQPHESTLKKAKEILAAIPDDEPKKSQLVKDVTMGEVANDKLPEFNTFKQNQKKNKSNFNLERKEADTFKSVAIRYNEKYGRHLVALKDYEPGEVIYVEKFYATCLSQFKAYTNCHHCLASCWSLIPCETCTTAMFCSEQCKKEASENYHNIECPLMSFIEIYEEKFIVDNCLSIRLLAMAFSKAGGIEELKSKLKAIDNKIAKNPKSFYSDPKLAVQFITAYSLSNEVTEEKYTGYAFATGSILLSMVKLTTMFKNLSCSSVDDLIFNEDCMFVGSLLLKLQKIVQINSFALQKSTEMCDHFLKRGFHSWNYCKAVGLGLGLTSSFINHSCHPNVCRGFTDNGRMVVYAIQPINKSSQLFDTYRMPFYEMSKIERQIVFRDYGFTCDCIACKKNWPPVLKIEIPMDNINRGSHKIYEDLQNVASDIQFALLKAEAAKDFSNVNFFEIVKSLSKSIQKALKNLPFPCNITCKLLNLMKIAFVEMTAPKTLVFEKCVDTKDHKIVEK